MTRVCGYVRVSTEEQQQSGLGLQAQRDTIHTACDVRGFELGEVFEDIASGRSMENRAGLQAALAAVDAGQVDGLIASKLDRLGRSVADVATTIEYFTRRGKTLVLLDVGIDTSTMMGAAMAQMASVFAELERKRISQRTSEALRALPRHRRNGRPVYSEDARTEAKRLRSQGMTLREIASALAASGVTAPRGGTAIHASAVSRLLAD